jgi:hypothetical protein
MVRMCVSTLMSRLYTCVLSWDGEMEGQEKAPPLVCEVATTTHVCRFFLEYVVAIDSSPEVCCGQT